MNSVFENIIEKLEEEKMSYFLTIANTGDEKLDCTYEQVGNALDKAIEIVKQEAEHYEERYKDCGDCEAYNKEKYHCPKFCKVIKEAVKEIEENHNIISDSPDVEAERKCGYYKCMTQGDRIRSMMDEELAEFIEQVSTDSMETISFGTKEYEEIWEHKETALQWLQSEVEE